MPDLPTGMRFGRCWAGFLHVYTFNGTQWLTWCEHQKEPR